MIQHRQTCHGLSTRRKRTCGVMLVSPFVFWPYLYLCIMTHVLFMYYCIYQICELGPGELDQQDPLRRGSVRPLCVHLLQFLSYSGQSASGCSASAGTVAVCHKLSRRAVSKPLRNARNKWSCCARHNPDHGSWETSTAKKKSYRRHKPRLVIRPRRTSARS